MSEIMDCAHGDCRMMLGEKGKGIARWCKDCGAHNPGEGCDWIMPRRMREDISEEMRHQLDRTYERIEDLEKRLLKERVEHGETFLRCQKSDSLLREIKLTMPHVEAGYDGYDAKVTKLQVELEERGFRIGRQREQIERLRGERDDAVLMRDAARCRLQELQRRQGGDVHEMKDMKTDLRNHRAKEACYRELIGSFSMVLNNESDAHKKHDAS